MKKSIQSVFLAFVFLTLLVSGCAPAPIPPTSTSMAIPSTKTPVPPTSTPIPPTATSTLTPTATAIPEMGMPISSKNWTVTLMAVSLLKRGVKDAEIGGEVLPASGTRFVSLGFRVTPIDSIKAVNISLIGISDANGQKYGPYYFGMQDAIQEADPLDISVKRVTHLAIIGADINIATDSYVHMIVQIPSDVLDKENYFNFDDVPVIPFTIE